MKGKIGLVVGLGAGYVLGTRAGRERYEQIKTQWLKLWNQDAVQQQVHRVTDFASSQAAAVPRVLWTGAVRLVHAVTGETTAPHQREAAARGKEAVAEAADDVADAAKKTTARKPATKKSADATSDADSAAQNGK